MRMSLASRLPKKASFTFSARPFPISDGKGFRTGPRQLPFGKFTRLVTRVISCGINPIASMKKSDNVCRRLSEIVDVQDEPEIECYSMRSLRPLPQAALLCLPLAHEECGHGP